MKASKAFCIGALVMAIFFGVYLKMLAKRPDYNPFVAFEMFANLRSVSTLESLNGEVLDIYDELRAYPLDKGALLTAVQGRKPNLVSAVAGIPFVYHSDGRSYMLFWTAGDLGNHRNVFLVENGEYYFSLDGYVKRRMIPAIDVTCDRSEKTGARSDDSEDCGGGGEG